jgi:hypothetical protein
MFDATSLNFPSPANSNNPEAVIASILSLNLDKSESAAVKATLFK